MATLLASGAVLGQLVPQDYYGGAHQGSDVIRRNDGQVFDADGHPRPDVKAVFEASPVGIWLRDSSRVSYTLHILHNDSTMADTAMRVDMTMRGAKAVSPTLLVAAPGVTNYYRGSTAVEQVPAFHRGIYEDVSTGIDLDLYGSSGGPRMAIVMHPGADPSLVKLQFTGQDSLGIDWEGALKIYLSGKWVRLEQAVAYQVAENGSLVDVNWTASYTHQSGAVDVGFTFGTYDTALPLVLQIGYGPAALGGSPANQRNLSWSSYVGGTGGDELTCVETDEDGNLYVCGHTWASDFPVHPENSVFNPAIGDFSGDDDAVLMKFDASNKQLIWATYYAGSTPATSGSYAMTEAQKIAVTNSFGYVFAVGTTNCTDFSSIANSGTPFANAVHESYLVGQHRMWVGAFLELNGVCDWATTHGQSNGYTWKEEGLSIAFGPHGQLAVGGRLVGNNPSFQAVTPTGAFHRATGGGFVLLFNDADYTIQWASAFGGHPLPGQPPHTQVSDMRFIQSAADLKLWTTGMSIGDNTYWGGLDYYNPPELPNGDPLPPNEFYHNYGMAFLASFDANSFKLDYCTGWGQNTAMYAEDLVSVGYGLDYDGQYLWMVGGTHSLTLTDDDCPDPGGSGVYHTHVNSGGSDNFAKCDGFILAFDPENYVLKYGTLLGGYDYDMLLDVAHDADNIYITGETRSTTHYTTDLDPDRYFQSLNPNGTSRDAVILAIKDDPASPTLLWQTPFGGLGSERGWGIAANSTEVYLTGGSASTDLQNYPLKEFSTSSDLDLYQDINFGGDAYSFLDYYQFEYGLDGENSTPTTNPEPAQQPHDGLIASFNLQWQNTVGIPEPNNAAQVLAVYPLPISEAWSLHFPHAGDWTVNAYSAAGQQVGLWYSSGPSLVVDLTTQAPGMYLLRATMPSGKVLHAKVIRP